MEQEMVTRRSFVRAGGTLALASAIPTIFTRPALGRVGPKALRAGLIGCGGRGTGAAENFLAAAPETRITALGDVFSDRLQSCKSHLASLGDRASVADDRCFTGFDAYEKVIACDVDVVLLATPPQFRPRHFKAAVDAGRHVFMEKPVAVDPTGVRTVLVAADVADARSLSVVAGTQRRHETSYREAMDRIRSGALGRIVAGRCAWNMGGLWMNEPRPEWSDMEWQLRNWLYFTWLSGDHIVEQHVHNIDVMNWAIGAHPIRAIGMGGRQVRTDPNYGNVFDHFAVEYEYPDGVFVMSMCRQTDGCASRVAEAIHGCDGWCELSPGHAVIRGRSPWRFEGSNGNPYLQEHIDLVASIHGRVERINEARAVAESTLSAIMGRMSAYTGQEVTWEQAMNSKLDLTPPAMTLGPLAVAPVAMPGKTPLL
jgi:predicted dehydrogenase